MWPWNSFVPLRKTNGQRAGQGCEVTVWEGGEITLEAPSLSPCFLSTTLWSRRIFTISTSEASEGQRLLEEKDEMIGCPKAHLWHVDAYWFYCEWQSRDGMDGNKKRGQRVWNNQNNEISQDCKKRQKREESCSVSTEIRILNINEIPAATFSKNLFSLEVQ